MNSKFEVLFYLDNAEVSLIEIAIPQKYKWFREFPAMAWFVLYKRKNAISLFRFESYFSKPKIKRKLIESGILKISRPAGFYTIAIGTRLFEFTALPVKSLPMREEILLEAYFEKAAV